MGGRIFLLTSAFIGFTFLKTLGQDTSMSYKDSVKEFLVDFIATKKLKDALVSRDPTRDEFDSDVKKRKAPLYPIRKVYERASPRGKTNKERISINPQEKNKILALLLPPISEWTDEYLPSVHIINQEVADSIQIKAHEIGDAKRRFYDKVDYDMDVLKRDPAYIKYCNSIGPEAQLIENGYWILSKPVFIKHGQFAAFYYHHIYFDVGSGVPYAAFCLGLYKREQGTWVYFAEVMGGNLN